MTGTTELDSLHSALGEAERYAKELEGKVRSLEVALFEARQVIDMKNQKLDDLEEWINVNFSSRKNPPST